MMVKPLHPLPAYKVRESRKAKYVSIKISHLGEVEVVIPPGFDRLRIPDIIHKRQDWIEQTLSRIVVERRLFASETIGPLPDQIVLRLLPEDWSVSYEQTAASTVKAIARGRQLQVRGAIEQVDVCHQVLRLWLQRKALLHLEPLLRQVSEEIMLPCGKVSVRGQKTRWASCSNKHNISLNYKLLFLPPALVRYVFIHELCHTVHLNHSHLFWHLVGEKEPGYELLDAELNQAWRYVPEWVER